MNLSQIGTRSFLRQQREQAIAHDSDWQIEQINHIRNRCRSILRDERATEEDRNIARAMLEFFSDASYFTPSELRMDEARLADLERRANR